MQLIKLDATASTNVYLKNLMFDKSLPDFTVVSANEQLKGKGQMGSSWQSEKGKNLTFSVLKYHKNILVGHQFILNILVSLAIYNTLTDLKIPDLSIKWPNDILSGRKKICGILIENTISGQRITTSILGIGLNVNQTKFDGLVHVSSLQLITGKKFDLNEILQLIVENLEKFFFEIGNQPEIQFKEAYLKRLFRKDKPSTFKNTQSDQLFMGIIRNITDNGKLVVEVEGQLLSSYDLKEIRLLY